MAVRCRREPPARHTGGLVSFFYHESSANEPSPPSPLCQGGTWDVLLVHLGGHAQRRTASTARNRPVAADHLANLAVAASDSSLPLAPLPLAHSPNRPRRGRTRCGAPPDGRRAPKRSDGLGIPLLRLGHVGRAQSSPAWRITVRWQQCPHLHQVRRAARRSAPGFTNGRQTYRHINGSAELRH